MQLSAHLPNSRWLGQQHKSRQRRRLVLGYPLIIVGSLIALCLFILAMQHRGVQSTQAAAASSLRNETAATAVPATKTAADVPIPAMLVAPIPTNSSFVVTVVSAHRAGGAYLPKTLLSLYCALNATSKPSDWPPVLVVNTEVPSSRHEAVVEVLISPAYAAFFKQGLAVHNVTNLHSELHAAEYVVQLMARVTRPKEAAIEQVKLPANGDPAAAGRAKMAAGDPADRFWWRSKEALDTAYALEVGLQAAPKAEYIIFLQDDIMLAAGFVQQLQEFIKSKADAEGGVDVVTLFTSGYATTHFRVADAWGVHYGAVGLAIRRAVAQEVISYFRTNFADAPVDWLFNAFILDNHKSLWVHYPGLVQHVGVKSSLAGKQQPIGSTTFKDRTCWKE